jgi:hypothetical protein
VWLSRHLFLVPVVPEQSSVTQVLQILSFAQLTNTC